MELNTHIEPKMCTKLNVDGGEKKLPKEVQHTAV